MRSLDPKSSVAYPVNRDTISVLLIDDQPLIAERIRGMLADCKDVVLHYCQDATQAMKMAEVVHPTLILQDLAMPQVDGLMLVRFFRANPNTRDVPMIVLSSEEDAKVKAEAFTLGVNDYMVKLPEQAELVARILYHCRGYINLMQRNEAYRKLEDTRQALERDLADAADYVRSILPPAIDDERIKAEWKFIPSAALGGDVFDYHWLDDTHFAIYLLDVCGHGVGAALLSMSVANLLRTQVLADTNFFEPDMVLKALNQRFQMEQHRNMFFTMWYGVFDQTTRRLCYASAGHPPAVLLVGRTGADAKTLRLRTQGLPVGAMANTIYESQSVKVDPFNKLFVFSDGVYELFGENGKVLEIESVIKVMEEPGAELGVDRVLKYAQSINGPGPFPDDFSIIGVTFK